jgi:low temperature requirement protein LtrA
VSAEPDTAAQGTGSENGRRPRFRQRILPSDAQHGVTTLELFFDLVFVFAITQVTAFMADDLGWRGALRGLVLLLILWWAWCSYAWLGNQAHADEGVVRAGVYAVAAVGDAGLRRQLLRTALPVGVAAALLVVGALLGGVAQTVLWALALVVDYTGVYLSGTDWRLPAPRHFAERHGLIVIIALGESIIAVGVGVGELPITLPIIAAALLGLAVSVALWWLYFDVVAPVAERVLSSKEGTERVRLARDSYTYLHFPMIAGIIYLALGLKKVAEYVADTEHHALTDPLKGTGLWALYGGVAVYLLAHLAFRMRNVGSINRPRAVVAVLLLVAPLGVRYLPALAALGVLALVLGALIAFEVLRYADARAAIRAEAAHH